MIPDRYTEKEITAQKTTSGSLIFYQLLRTGQPVHPTFAREKHIQAVGRNSEAYCAGFIAYAGCVE
jgi:hypothetical protein